MSAAAGSGEPTIVAGKKKVLLNKTAREVAPTPAVVPRVAKEDVSETTKEFYSKQPKEQRQKLGQFYTNRKVIEKSLTTIDTPKSGLVLEPTAGSGEYIDALLKNGYTRIVANEFDEYPYQLLKQKYESRGVSVLKGDYLTKQFGEKFDLVIGNPPYFMMEGEMKPSKEQEAQLKKQFGDALKGRKNIYVLSTIKGVQDLKEGGTLSFVIPTSILTSPMFQVQRDWIRRHAQVERVEILDSKDEFEGAKVEVMIFQLKKTQTPNNDFIAMKNGKLIFTNKKEGKAEAEGLQRLGSLATFKTGSMDVSKIKEEGNLSDSKTDETIPILYAENIIDGEVKTNKSKLKGKRKQFLRKDYAPRQVIQAPFLLIARTIGSKNKLNVALVEGSSEAFAENHTIVGKAKSMEDLRKVYEILTDDEYIKPFLSETYGQVKTISNSFLSDLPIPSAEE